MLAVHLVGLNQRFDFSSGTVSNVLTVRLPNGQTFDTTVSPEHLKPIMNAFAEAHVRGGGSLPVTPAPAPVERTEAPVPLDDEAMREDAEFGGMSTFGGPPEAPARQSTIATGPVPTTVTRPAPARTVARNEAGYPVLAGGVDPSRVLGDGPDTDEDGVAQA